MLTAGLVAGFVVFLASVWHIYPPQLWLFFDYVKYWAVTIVFNLASLSVGAAAMKKLVPTGLRLRERAVLSIALGTLIFFLGMYVAGLFHLYGGVFFVLFPALLIGVGTAGLWRSVDRAVPLWKRARRLPYRRPSWTQALIFASGVIGLFMVYAPVIVPENTAYDSKWYHLPIAEHYVAVGGMERFVEGWFQGALPHLSSFLYAWPMMAPFGSMTDKVLMCAHLEFTLFLWTLFAIPVLVRFIVPTSRPSLAWVAMFLFPGIFLYDSSLGIAADRVAAFWAIPIFLALALFWRTFELRLAVLLGALLAAAMLTKYQAISLVVLPIGAVVARFVWLTFKAPTGKRTRPLISAVVAGAVMIAVFAPHWLKNWVWYGDPAYPWTHKYFASRPWTPDTAQRLESIHTNHLWTPRGDSTAEKLWVTAKAVGTFSLIPNDWVQLHRNVPVFGSLFTLLVFALPFLRAPRRLWGLFMCANAGVFAWYWQSHQDRYLQALVPWMAAFVATALVLAWRSGALVRVALTALVGLQVVWGGDVPFIGTHRQIGQSPLKFAVDRMASGFNGAYAARQVTGSQMQILGEQLPADARVLTHEEEQHSALMRPVVSDWAEWQGGLSYGRFKSPAELHDRYMEYGITHIVQIPERSRDYDALPSDIVYYDYVTHFAKLWKMLPPWKVMTPAPTRPPETPYRPVLWLGCDGLYDNGVYSFDQMMTPFWAKKTKADVGKPIHKVNAKDRAAVDAALSEVDSVGYDSHCVPFAPTDMRRQFVKVVNRGTAEVWIRRR